VAAGAVQVKIAVVVPSNEEIEEVRGIVGQVEEERAVESRHHGRNRAQEDGAGRELEVRYEAIAILQHVPRKSQSGEPHNRRDIASLANVMLGCIPLLVVCRMLPVRVKDEG